MKEITKIKETCLYIKDLDAAKDFYHGKLGLGIIHHEPGKHIFFRAGSSVLLCFNPEDSKAKKSPPPHYAEGNQHFAFEVEQKDYDAVKAQIASLGIKIIDQLVWKSGQESFYFNDPEGNVLEFVPIGVWD
ncbi:hypothetical protein C900_03190 [Fulvivirga imtechensis AK7]|uniref:VOC domain-containing protein n=1 Tax=Fulvivirga imtechensis AK7 TaxID=1237149 RepID=L8JQC8_9BACT|nr:VOC family protein [Fulvivirga imtechensis]ELR71060.1 hypothetical protein C900_03190 [Fulvivirga imtechensis AK7]